MRNIVILCDGTGNEISQNISNVLKLYRCLRKTEKTQPRQLVFYDPGVGTLERPDPWHRLRQNFNAILGLATGYGLDDNVLAAYAFLVENYQDGDQIYLFGFSRGAYTVRVLAGLIHKVGLIAPQQVNLAGSGLIAYKQFSSDVAPQFHGNLHATDAGDEDGPLAASPFDNAAQFARITSSRWPTIKFVGVWDTVASVIVPRPDRLYWPSLEELAFTLQNPSVQIFRQAISIDERRCMFRLKKWDDPQTFAHNRFNDAHSEPQDIKQVWFAGVHADIGGGYPEIESGLSKYPLLWMIDEAVAMRARRQPAHRQSARLGRAAQGQPVLLRRARCLRRSAQFIDGRVVDSRIPAEERQIPGMAGAQGAFRLLHSGWRAALDSGRRIDPRIRGEADGHAGGLSPGQFAGALRDRADAYAARAGIA